MEDKNGVSIPYPGMTLEEEILELREEVSAAQSVEVGLRKQYAECHAAYHELRKQAGDFDPDPTPDFPPIPMESVEDAETRKMNDDLKRAEDRGCPPGGFEQGPGELLDD